MKIEIDTEREMNRTEIEALITILENKKLKLIYPPKEPAEETPTATEKKEVVFFQPKKEKLSDVMKKIKDNYNKDDNKTELSSKRQNKTWNNHEKKYLRDNCINKNTEELSKYLGRTEEAIRQRLDILGLPKHRAKRKYTKKTQYNKYKIWTSEDDKYITEKYDKENTDNIAKQLGRTKASIHTRAQELGVYKSPETKKRGRIPRNELYAKPVDRLSFIHSRAKYLVNKYSYNYEKAIEVATSEYDLKAFVKVKPQIKTTNKWFPDIFSLSRDGNEQLRVALQNIVATKDGELSFGDFGVFLKYSDTYNDVSKLMAWKDTLHFVAAQISKVAAYFDVDMDGFKFNLDESTIKYN